MADLEMVRALPDFGKGHAELYKRGDEHIVVSTINLSADVYSSSDRAFIGIGAMLGGYASSGEETMAFASDENGVVEDWCEIAVSTGAGSRDEVLEELRDAS